VTATVRATGVYSRESADTIGRDLRHPWPVIMQPWMTASGRRAANRRPETLPLLALGSNRREGGVCQLVRCDRSSAGVPSVHPGLPSTGSGQGILSTTTSGGLTCRWTRMRRPAGRPAAERPPDRRRSAPGWFASSRRTARRLTPAIDVAIQPGAPEWSGRVLRTSVDRRSNSIIVHPLENAPVHPVRRNQESNSRNPAGWSSQ
jgi:hypothetical protein